jgi:hypothetical protein
MKRTDVLARKNGLVAGFIHLEKYEFVNGRDYISHIYEMENKTKCSKPPTSCCIDVLDCPCA